MTNEKCEEIRTNLLLCLYDAKSKKSASLLISEIQRLMKQKFGYKQQEVASNLDYLVQIDWVRTVITTKAVPLPSGTTIDRSRETYKISSHGIDTVQGGSLYKPQNVTSSINIHQVSGVVVTGSGNVVNQNLSHVATLTSELRSAVERDKGLQEEQKLNLLSDIDSFATQLQKPVINRPVIRMLWDGVQAAASVAGAADLLQKLGAALGPYLA